MGFDSNFEKGIMMGLNFHETPANRMGPEPTIKMKSDPLVKSLTSKYDNRKRFDFPGTPLTPQS